METSLSKKERHLLRSKNFAKRPTLSNDHREVHVLAVAGTDSEHAASSSGDYLALQRVFHSAKWKAEAGAWMSRDEALSIAPIASGLYQIGVVKSAAFVSNVDIVYIGHTGSETTLRETILPVLFGWEECASDQLAMFLVNPANKNRIRVRWCTSVCPEELIDECVDEFIATSHKVPRFNAPLESLRGLWTLEDRYESPTHESADETDDVMHV